MAAEYWFPQQGAPGAIKHGGSAPTLDGTEELFVSRPANSTNGPATTAAVVAGGLNGATVAEVNAVADSSSRIVNATAATLTVTQALHDGKIILLDRAGGVAVTMPEAADTGMVITFLVKTKFTSDATITLADTTNTTLLGGALIADSAGGVTQEMFTPGATEDLVTLDGTNTGGGLGCQIQYIDLATDVWSVRIVEYVGGTVPATPFTST